jgi:GT2 family glycosyltransferase
MSTSTSIKATAGIVAYNTDIGILGSTIKSLLSCTTGLRVIILCNSPLASYQQAVQDLCAEFKVDCFPNQANGGFGKGHNDIVRQVSTEWYICCNPDVVVNPTAIENLISFAETKNDAIILSPRIVGPSGETHFLARRHLTILTWLHRQLWRIWPSVFSPFEFRFDYGVSQKVEFPSGAFFAIRTRHFKQLEGFNEEYFLYCEDADFARRASNIGHNYYVSGAEVIHAWDKAWSRSTQMFLQELKSLYKYFRIHGFSERK